MENILQFLSELKENNNRDWMHDNKSRYNKMKAEFEFFVELLINEIRGFDPSIGAVTPKECIFRLNRDIRFSADKTPYKTHFGAFVAKDGRKSKYGGYYLHITPGESFMAGGVYCPMSAELKKIRREVALEGDELLEIIKNPGFKSVFGELWGEKLKTAPRDYPKDHKYIELLRHKHFIVNAPLTNDQVTSDDFMAQVIPAFKTLYPFNRFLNEALEIDRSEV